MLNKIKTYLQGKKLSQLWFPITIGLIVIYTGYSLLDLTIRNNAIKEERAAISKKIEEETALQEKLQTECERLKDPAYIEQVAREELGLVKNGEIPYISREKKTH